MPEPDVDRVMREIAGIAAQVKRQLAPRVLQALTSATPVDTGFARSRWTPSVGPPPATPVANLQSREARVASARAFLAANQARVQRIAIGRAPGEIYISNRVPYIGSLNAGSSSQAPARFVERAVASALRNFRVRVA